MYIRYLMRSQTTTMYESSMAGCEAVNQNWFLAPFIIIYICIYELAHARSHALLVFFSSSSGTYYR